MHGQEVASNLGFLKLSRLLCRFAPRNDKKMNYIEVSENKELITIIGEKIWLEV